MDTATTLPHLNAALNAVTAVLLVAGVGLARRRRAMAHRVVMAAAVVVSAVFLVSYLVYHVTAPVFVFAGTGWVRPAYYAMLVSHVLAAAAVTPMVALTVWRGATGRLDRHRPLARWTWPLWLYVAVTGVVIYGLLYHVYAPAP
jgi:uncharacterized membrane protein YozB (DUF420 family)